MTRLFRFTLAAAGATAALGLGACASTLTCQPHLQPYQATTIHRPATPQSDLAGLPALQKNRTFQVPGENNIGPGTPSRKDPNAACLDIPPNVLPAKDQPKNGEKPKDDDAS
ncbi:MAG: hypothetical protein PVJ40_09700 [Gammaproteobacteria bacterium]|jgi:hypothetical protein